MPQRPESADSGRSRDDDHSAQVDPKMTIAARQSDD
jgi:hypothetical protein